MNYNDEKTDCKYILKICKEKEDRLRAEYPFMFPPRNDGSVYLKNRDTDALRRVCPHTGQFSFRHTMSERRKLATEARKRYAASAYRAGDSISKIARACHTSNATIKQYIAEAGDLVRDEG